MCRIYTTFYGTFYLSFIYLSTNHASYCSRHIIRQNNISNIHFFTALRNHNIHLLFLRYSAFAFKLLSIRYLSTARLFDLSLNTLLFHSSYTFFHVRYRSQFEWQPTYLSGQSLHGLSFFVVISRSPPLAYLILSPVICTPVCLCRVDKIELVVVLT